MNAQPNAVSISACNGRLAALLRESHEKFLSSLEGVGDEQSRRHVAEGGWSVLDCAEHIAVAEMGMLRLLTGPRRPRPADALNREEMFLQRMPDRSQKVEAPEGARPSGRFTDLEAARRQFETARARTIRFVEENIDDLRATEITHPLALFGDVSAYELVIIMAKHSERHALQIEEIRKGLGN